MNDDIRDQLRTSLFSSTSAFDPAWIPTQDEIDAIIKPARPDPVLSHSQQLSKVASLIELALDFAEPDSTVISYLQEALEITREHG